MILGIAVACVVLVVLSLIGWTRIRGARIDREATDAVEPWLEEIEAALRDSVLVEQAQRKVHASRRARG